MSLTEKQIERYTHHIVLKDIGGEGQKKLLASRVLIIGAGGLGSPAALYLAAAGVGTIGIADHDRVELGNLQRQILHSTSDVGREKVTSAKESLQSINADVKVKAYPMRLTEENVDDLIKDFHFIIDGSDNFDTKFLISDACVHARKPCSIAGVSGFKGQAFTYLPGSACYRCIFDCSPPSGCAQDCSGGGVLGATAGILGSIQAAEAIKFLIGRGDLITDRLLTVNLLTMEFRTIRLNRTKTFPTCGGNITPHP